MAEINDEHDCDCDCKECLIDAWHAEVEDVRRMVRQNLPMVRAHIDKHPDVAKRMCDAILEWVR